MFKLKCFCGKIVTSLSYQLPVQNNHISDYFCTYTNFIVNWFSVFCGTFLDKINGLLNIDKKYLYLYEGDSEHDDTHKAWFWKMSQGE